jgi:methylase of polypeptide subunit release factors
VDAPTVHWVEEGRERSARWRSERGAPAPKKVVLADDRMRAEEAYGLAAQGVGLLWRGDFHNARQLLAALAKRHDRQVRRKGVKGAAMPEAFNLERQARAQRARTLGMLLVPLEGDYSIPLARAPDLREAFHEARGVPDGQASVISLRELQGIVGAHEWRVKGVEVPALGARIHPHYGVFAPIRSEYIELVARAPLPGALATCDIAFDVGTGTGVLAALLARRGVGRVVATDMEPRAIACARENLSRLGVARQVEVVTADLFPEGRAALAVCNPPWVPARPSSPLEHGIYDPDSRMMRGFLRGLSAHLVEGGEGWLILSDLAEHLGLRTRAALLGEFETAGLRVVERMDIRPRHPRVGDAADPLHAARAAEVTSLWRLAPAASAAS